jgi:hypothetical protein
MTAYISHHWDNQVYIFCYRNGTFRLIDWNLVTASDAYFNVGYLPQFLVQVGIRGLPIQPVGVPLHFPGAQDLRLRLAMIQCS